MPILLLQTVDLKATGQKKKIRKRARDPITKSFPHQTAVFKFCLWIHAVKAGPGLKNVRPAYSPCCFSMKAPVTAREKERPLSHSLSNVLDPDFRNHKNVFPESKDGTLTLELPKWKQTCNEDSPVKLRQS